MQRINVPGEFQPGSTLRYPCHQNGFRAEPAVFEYFGRNDCNTSLVYLPIFWDNWLVNHGFGRDVVALQNYLTSTMLQYQDKRVWTICEYADGICVDAPKNLHVFYCARTGGTSLPLICDPHPIVEQPKSLLASFVGSLETHPIRKEMVRAFGMLDNMIVSGPSGTNKFEELMAKSYFALCPRGYGPTSYRLYEAIQMGIVPVYISDTFILPYEDKIIWEDFCVLVGLDGLPELPKLLQSLVDNGKHQKMRERILTLRDEWFTMEAMCKYINKYLEER